MWYVLRRKRAQQQHQEERRARAARFFLVPGLATALSGMLLACGNPLASTMPWGSLTIQVNQPQALLMAPGISMAASSYLISGSGPNGAAFSKTTSDASLSMPGLALGSWTIVVDGQNSAGTLITHGSASVNVVAGANQTVNVTMTPLSGPGALSLTVTWPAGGVDMPAVQSQLVPGSGSPIDLAFTIPSAGKATYSSSAVPNGYYTLVVKLLDNGQLVMGAVDVVRIVNAQTTSGTIDFSKVNTGTGTILLNISPTLNNPVLVTMAGQVSELGVGTAATVTASVPPGTGAVTYVWYLNGVSKSTGASYSFNAAGAPLSPGNYRLDVAAFTASGTRGGSATTSFKVFSVASATLVWDKSTDPSVVGYKFYKGTASGVYGTPVDVGPATTYTAAGLLSGHTYYFAVTSYNSAGKESGFSNEVAYTVP